ncbi:hypothetical protein [Microcystis aeruginosa]|jgi:hypothetical protein|uniref:hypothetical protein n=1 Tax=Microcystis aeruginosa TaxID=1126 RepID=UPI00232CC041|nr:hypothetical protein [Microcystis aeruginosa]MDB9390489.1 hypothetical protein [Microcystis aeruginosa CS-579]
MGCSLYYSYLNLEFRPIAEVIVEESVEQIKKQLAEKSPDTLKQLEGSWEDDTDALGQPIQMMATCYCC